MNKPIVFAFLAAIVSLPGEVLGASIQSSNAQPKPITLPKDRSTPEPTTMLLVGAAAAGLFGVRKLLRKKRD